MLFLVIMPGLKGAMDGRHFERPSRGHVSVFGLRGNPTNMTREAEKGGGGGEGRRRGGEGGEEWVGCAQEEIRFRDRITANSAFSCGTCGRRERE
ncbi:hypothetical protein HZH66_013498 [Vespula vulgaris]|uniref:Uncharacterized protein n=1 Tax=Vespula vulgaris TaxID=7454 RepID=A0A834JAJ2_VESVU|nr:hypothetical protein HZH66_013498 [Vespula vulgaris]